MGRARANLCALEVLDRLDSEGGDPTPAELAILGQWSGWGPMARALKKRVRDEPWREIGQRVRHLLSADHTLEAEQATFNAFYTPASVVRIAWEMAVNLGFPGGQVLEPGCGHGCFMSAVPDGLDVQLTGVERDPTSARIAKLLHPDARIVNRRLEKVALQAGTFDLVIGNVPFGDVNVYDRNWDQPFKLAIHNYFTWRSLEAVKPGGLVVLVTSRYTLDAEAKEHRRLFHQMAELIGALRLPSEWEAEYGSSVVADILVFRRRQRSETIDELVLPDWVETYEWLPRRYPGMDGIKQFRDKVVLNRYWREHQDHVAGQMVERGGQQYGMGVGVDPDGPIVPAISAAAKAIEASGRRRGLLWTPPEAVQIDAELEPTTDEHGRPEGSFHVESTGAVMQIVRGRPELAKRCVAELRALVGIRNAVQELLRAERDPDAPDAIEVRERLNRLYDAYVDQHGYLNRALVARGPDDPDTGEPTISRRRPAVMSAFREDPDYALVLSVELYDDEKGAMKAPILLGRINRRPPRKTHADTPAEAIALCLDELGWLSTRKVAELLGISRLAVERALGDLAYRNPETNDLEPADQYLSGNVRVKLTAAKEAARRSRDFERNVKALEAVIPEDLAWQDISARLGAPWVSTGDVKAFVEETIGALRSVHHQVELATWQLEVPDYQRGSANASSLWGISRKGFDAYSLVQMALNGQTPICYDEVKVDGESKRVKNIEDTTAADEKIRALHERFGQWLWEDPERTDRLTRVYNDLYNATVIRKFDGSHLTFRGLAAHITPYQHQLDMAYRGISTPASLAGLAVGAGKTGVIALTARKLRELGLANKPLAVVPNHLLEQTAREMLQWFPDARILMASSEDITAEKRRLFVARAATGDWDLIVMTHTSYTSLSVSPDVEAGYLQERITKFQQAIMDVAEGEEDQSVKRIAKAVKRMETRLEELLDIERAKGAVTFDLVGVDYLFVDESHYFKRLQIAARTEGFSLGHSKRASDLHMKLWHLRQHSEGKRVGMLLSGTPISNTLAELFVVQTFLQPERLEELKIANFDAWAGWCVEFEVKAEVAPDGTFRLYQRPSKFMNVPDLRAVFAEVAEILPSDRLNLERPELVAETIVLPLPAAIRDFLVTLARRADAIRNGGVPKTEDNMLNICNDGRKAALHPSLVGLETDEPGKVEAVADNVLRIWREHGGAAPLPEEPKEPWWGMPQSRPDAVEHALEFASISKSSQVSLFEWADLRDRVLQKEAQRDADRLAARQFEQAAIEARKDAILQVVFCDLGTPGAKGPQVYGLIRDRLVAGGMDPRRIRFVHDAKTTGATATLFEDCRAGKVDVLCGSTDKLGVGVNIQTRLKAIHHVDPPWRPSDIEQREGRGYRPGNRNKVLLVFRYVVEGSFDGYMWQALDRKKRFIAQVLCGDLTARVVPDIGDIVLSYTEVKALATGNQELMELAEVEGRLNRYRTLRTVHRREARRLEGDAQDADWRAERRETYAATMERIAGAAKNGEPNLLRPGAMRLSVRSEIGNAMSEAVTEAKESGETIRIGTYRGQSVSARAQRVGKTWMLRLLLSPFYHTESGHPVEVQDAHLGAGQTWRLVQALDDVIDAAAVEAQHAREDVSRLRNHAVALRAQAEQPWDQDPAYEAALARKADIERRMNEAAGQKGEQAA